MNSEYLPKNHLEKNLPDYLESSLIQYKIGLEKYKQGSYSQIDLDWNELRTDINQAERCGEISKEQARYLRDRYLYKGEDTLD